VLISIREKFKISIHFYDMKVGLFIEKGPILGGPPMIPVPPPRCFLKDKKTEKNEVLHCFHMRRRGNLGRITKLI
jgi:hypothetical protein